MNKISFFFSITLILLSSHAMAEEAVVDDLRYCLGLQSNYEIAKCAGEISAGNKGKPYTKEEVDKMLAEQRANMPAAPIVSTDIPVTPAESLDEIPPDNQIKDVLLEQDEGGNN
jgi:hypothetical protein